MPPLGILMKRFRTFLFSSLKDCTIGRYLSIEPVIFQKDIGLLSLAGSLFQSHIPCGGRASQAIREDLTKHRQIVPRGFHLPTKHV